MGAFVYLVCIAVASFTVLAQPAVAQEASATLPLTYSGEIVPGDGSQTCPSEEQREIERNKVDNATLCLLRESVLPLLQGYMYSCGGSTGWRRVAYLNMSDPSHQCPSVWKEITYSTGSEQYDQVCGRIIGYQISTPDAFNSAGRSIDTYYIDGVSVTYDSPRQHIWSFVGGVNEEYSGSSCPCVTGSTSGTRIPSFVGWNYFCETGITSGHVYGYFYPNGDPLWDGQGCGPTSSCCTFNSPPWFNVQLSSPTTDDIEVRQVYSKTSYLLAHAYTHADYQVRFVWWLKVDNTDI